MPVESIKVPDLGDSKDVEVIELLVAVGQEVSENDSLLVLESDKAAMEIPSPRSGVVKSLSVKLGDQVSEGDEILMMEVEGSADGASDQDSASAAKEDKAEAKTQPEAATKSDASNESADEQPASGDQTEDAPAASGGVETIEVPDLGGDSDVEVIEIHVKAGDEIAAEDSLITLESDKAAMEIPSPKGGIVKSVLLKTGDKVSAGAAILELEVSASGGQKASAGSSKADGSSSADGSQKKAAPEPVKDVETPAAAADDASDSPAAASAQKSLQQKQNEYAASVASDDEDEGKVYAGPAVRKLARELGVTLTQVPGTGMKGRIQKEDVHEFVKKRLQQPAAPAAGAMVSAVPDIDFSQFGEIEDVPMSKLHRLTAANMQRNWNSVPHVFQFNEADITELEEFRNAQKQVADKKGVKLTLLPFLIKACARTLQEHPQFNVSLHSSGEYLIRKKYIHIGVAVATEAGLVVPVVRDADRKSVWDIAAEVAQLSDKARQRRLSKDDMQGACFTISSLGAIGGTGFTPIVNAPEVAILGVAKTAVKPVYVNGEFVPRQMLPLTLSYDHRAVNGVDGGQFATTLSKLLSDIRLLVL